MFTGGCAGNDEGDRPVAQKLMLNINVVRNDFFRFEPLSVIDVALLPKKKVGTGTPLQMTSQSYATNLIENEVSKSCR